MAGQGTTVSGNGSAANPYVVEATPAPAGGGGGGVDGRFTGEICAYAGSVAPTGWLLCNGATVSRTVYAALFSIVGIAYGAGNGTTTFTLPNLASRTPLGSGGITPRGTSGGTAEITLSTNNLPPHAHDINHDHPAFSTAADGVHGHPTRHSTGDVTGNIGTYQVGNLAIGTVDTELTGTANGAHTHSVDVPPFIGQSGSVGVGTPVPILPPYTAVTYLIHV